MTVKELKGDLDKYPDEWEIRFVTTDAKERSLENRAIGQLCAPVVIRVELNKRMLLDRRVIREAEENEQNSRWIPTNEKLPESADYVLMSFENFSLPAIGRYEVNDEGDGAWYLGDDDGEETCCSQDLFVNAWMPLPEAYKEESK